MKMILLVLVVFVTVAGFAQKKPLDHSVYDSWQSLGEKLISNDGRFVVYTVNVQEGDGTLIIQAADGKKWVEINRGYGAKITEDNKFVICKIKPLFQQTRTAKIQKKKTEEMPKDSLAIITISTLAIEKIPNIKSFKVPEKSAAFLVYLSEKKIPDTKPKVQEDSLTRIHNLQNIADSLIHFADSIKSKLAEVQTKGIGVLASKKELKTNNRSTEDNLEEGTDLTVLHLETHQKYSFKLVNDYAVSKTGNALAIYTTRKKSDSTSKATVIRYDLQSKKADTILRSVNDVKSISFDEAGQQLAFTAERDSSSKALQKFYKLYYYKPGYDTARLIADRNTRGIEKGRTVSEYGTVGFSKSGNRLFFGIAPILPPKDTSLPEFERAKLDVWNYKDDELMTVQLYNLERELKRNYLARYDFDKNEVVTLGNEKLVNVLQTAEGDGAVFYSTSDYGKRVEAQWQGYTIKEVYAVDPLTGVSTMILKQLKGHIAASYTGKYVLMYDERQKKYFVYDSQTKQKYQIAKDIPYPLYNEEFDMPDDPNAYGIIKWLEDDKGIMVYDRFDVWLVDPAGKAPSINLTNGRQSKNQFRYVQVNPEEKYISTNQKLVFRVYNEKDKSTALAVYDLASKQFSLQPKTEASDINNILKAKNADTYAFTRETFQHSPDLYVFDNTEKTKLSQINPQQEKYNWGTAELFKWKAYTGKETEGILYKPEGFDSHHKYPMIVYYYERNNNTLYNYLPPSPTPSRLNIPFFVSRGYIVFVPDIWYTRGHPGKNAYDYVVSGTRALISKGFIDSTKLGLQGQSWGGYQTAMLITQTHLFAAAWAGAPVVNMFSAYGGIRWESGLNRQFQYEHTQSRIGATPWERRDLYIENSPLFHLEKVKTPLVIMSNDADGAVPWYQGIEFFTDMRRLNKPVWLLSYNGEAHNLVERRNRKDISIREQQFFDWLLKGEKPPEWITEGVPAVLKGRKWGLDTQ